MLEIEHCRRTVEYGRVSRKILVLHHKCGLVTSSSAKYEVSCTYYDGAAVCHSVCRVIVSACMEDEFSLREIYDCIGLLLVRKGKGLKPEMEEAMIEHNVPAWFIDSCKKIKYMFPKAHAAAYVMSAIRLGWYKIKMPIVFYCAMFTVAPKGFDAEIVMGGLPRVKAYIQDVEKRGKEASAKEQDSIPTFQLVMECMARGIRFLPVHLEKSSAHGYVPENGAIRLPFSSLAGLGDTAAANIIKAREEAPFFSVEDLQIRAKISKSVIEMLRANGVLDNVSETDQLTMSF